MLIFLFIFFPCPNGVPLDMRNEFLEKSKRQKWEKSLPKSTHNTYKTIDFSVKTIFALVFAKPFAKPSF